MCLGELMLTRRVIAPSVLLFLALLCTGMEAHDRPPISGQYYADSVPPEHRLRFAQQNNTPPSGSSAPSEAKSVTDAKLPISSDASSVQNQAVSGESGLKVSQHAESSPLQIELLLILELATICGVVTALYFLIARGRSSPAPGTHNEVVSRVAELHGLLTEALRRSDNVGVAPEAKKASLPPSDAADLIAATKSLARSLGERDAELVRLRQGYDAEVFRRFLARFVRVKQAADGCLMTGDHGPEVLAQIARLLEDAFDECGVVQFVPKVGEDFRSAKGVSDTPRRIKATRPEDAFRIASVIEPGYRLRTGSATEVIVPAKVEVYVP
jgi:hypothetical protein